MLFLLLSCRVLVENGDDILIASSCVCVNYFIFVVVGWCRVS